MSFRLHIPQKLLNIVIEAGYPPLEEILQSGINLINLGIKRISLEIWIPGGPRSISFYRSPNFIHFDIEGCYTVLSIKDDDITVELLPDELMSSLYKFPVREFHRILKLL